MQKLLFLLAGFFVMLFACQKTKKPAVKSVWTNYEKAYGLLAKQPDSAFYYFNKVVSDSTDSLQIAMAYTNMAIIQSDAGDFYGALESASKSLSFLNEKDIKQRVYLVSDYNELGLNSGNMKNFDDAIVYYDKAISFTNNLSDKLIALNNKAHVYQEKKEYAAALKIYQAIINLAEPKGIVYARILANMNATRSLLDPNYNAVPELLKALNIRLQKNDLWGQNSSYAHLSDCYARSKPDSAVFYARANYAVSVRLGSSDNKLQALKRLIRYGLVKDIKQYFNRYQTLSDSIQTARNAAKNQFALIRYNVEKSKSDNLKLQKDNSEGKYQLFKQRILLYTALLASVTTAFFALFWYKKRKQRIEADVKDTIHANQLKTSKKVHDVVANGLYRIMTEIENQNDINKEHLLDSIEEMYEKSRDISYENILCAPHFDEKISCLLTSFSTQNVKVLIAGNTEELWQNAGNNIRYEIEHILQELMVNMKKHSKASNVALRFEYKNNRINIYYTDNGVGFPKAMRYKNGLTNTENRINFLHGIITFESTPEKGLKVFISFPLI